MNPKPNIERPTINELRSNEVKEEKNIFSVSATYLEAESKQTIKKSDNNGFRIKNENFDLPL